MLNEDYKEMLQCLLEEDVRFLLVGAYAVACTAIPEPPRTSIFLSVRHREMLPA
jgi:hypothetical protein